ncbi:MAG: amidohydrolase family protein, partial [Anaerolineae bacterium]|nr:amidohydrolase family protein [Anaerolineae bacterium]
TAQQRRSLVERGGGLIWCPGSNQFMFDRTAYVAELAAAERLALGCDSRLSGEFDLLAELRVASNTNQISPQALFRTVTVDAARLLRLGWPGAGRLEVGGAADLVLLPSADGGLFASLGRLTRAQVGLVLLAGRPLVGAESLQPAFDAAKAAWRRISVDGASKLMSRRLVKRLQRSRVGEPGLVVLN